MNNDDCMSRRIQFDFFEFVSFADRCTHGFSEVSIYVSGVGKVIWICFFFSVPHRSVRVISTNVNLVILLSDDARVKVRTR